MPKSSKPLAVIHHGSDYRKGIERVQAPSQLQALIRAWLQSDNAAHSIIIQDENGFGDQYLLMEDDDIDQWKRAPGLVLAPGRGNTPDL